MKEFFKKPSFKYISIFIIFVLFIASMAVKPVLTMSFGEEILIKTRAYDPRDVFRGDYIQLSYDINQISLDKIDEEIIELIQTSSNLNGKYLYIILKQQGKYYEVNKVMLDRPKEGLYLKAKYLYPLWDEKNYSNIKGIFVDLPLDKYFVPENTGKDLEEKVQKGEAFARIKVLRGYTVLVEVVAE